MLDVEICCLLGLWLMMSCHAYMVITEVVTVRRLMLRCHFPSVLATGFGLKAQSAESVSAHFFVICNLEVEATAKNLIPLFCMVQEMLRSCCLAV